ncbi:MAG: hypothetical protein AMR96_02910 [Candidatus Adiutrix intracellularis]|jgi:hypothetical protein|nr:MAG: hypothetical protein AMR96_02910 [Candidatus Adiutrix intracellularis]
MGLSFLGLSIITTYILAVFIFFEKSTDSSTEINPTEQPFKEFAHLTVTANKMITKSKLITIF